MTDKQQLFIAEYLINGFNATQAAITAGYSEKTARSQANALLTNHDIRKTLKDKIDSSLNVKKDVLEKQIIDKCVAIITASVTDYVDKRGFQTDWKGLDKRPIKSIERKLNAKGDETIKIDLHDPKPYIDILGKYIDLAGAKSENTVIVNNISDTTKMTDEQLRKIVSNS